MVRAAGELIAWWTGGLVLQMVFVDSLSLSEWAVAAAGALLAAVAARAVRVAAGARPGGRARLLSALLHWPGTLLTDTWRLAVLVARAVGGRRVTGRFHTVTLRRGVGAAWACGLLAATPGVYVADQGPGGRLLVHTLPGGASSLEQVLVGGRDR